MVNNTKELTLGGGCIRTLIDIKENVIDYDIFFSEEYGNIAKIFNKFLEIGFEVKWACPNGDLYNLSNGTEKIQLILPKTILSPEEWIEKFDIFAGCCAINNNILYISKEAIRDIKQKRITINKVSYPVATFFRINKYMKKGYRIHHEDVRLFFLSVISLINSSGDSWAKYAID